MDDKKYYILSVATRPLSRYRYRFDEVKGIQSEYEVGKDAAENLNVDIDPALLEEAAAQADSPIATEAKDIDESLENTEENIKPEKKKLRRIKKPNLSLFEEIVDEKALLEEEIDQLINKDHYYDVALPYDQDNQISMRKKKQGNKVIAGLFVLMAGVIAFIAWTIGDMVG
ncbi:hypothetical protein AALA24_12695 [Anaerovoracaceae bacterium 42-11]